MDCSEDPDIQYHTDQILLVVQEWAEELAGQDEEYNYKDMTDDEYNEADSRHYGNRVRYEMRQKIKEQLK